MKMKPNQETAVQQSQLQLPQLSGLQKAAILMIALKIDTASEVYKFLDNSELEMISAEISKVKNVSAQQVDGVLLEFYHMVTAREYMLEGGLDYAHALLEKSFGTTKAVEIIDKVKTLTTLKGFEVLKKADSSQLMNFLNKEHPQTIALILSHLTPSQTADALRELQEPLRTDVVHRIATLGKVSPQTLKQIEKVVDELAGLSIGQTLSALGGTKSLASILNKMSVTMSKDILDSLLEVDQDVATEVKRLMFLFEDIIHIEDKDIQKILREVDRKDLALSLKVSDERLKQKIFKNMSERGADLLKEELQFMGKVKLKDVEDSQAKIIDVIKNLEETGEITLNLSSNSTEIYV